MRRSLFIVWGDDDNLGIPLIDEQHRGIVAMINTLYYFMKRGEGERELLRMLEMLEGFFRIHFIVEEEMMARAGYREREAHAAAHADFLRKLADARSALDRVNDPLELLRDLKTWWVEHIRIEDRKFASLVRSLAEED
ncbi:MAG: bacteriohemerythrin [Epsilonproteobacteria bacterium]|nr:bacteriohemerythrin [Campylobacterota bacterium]